MPVSTQRRIEALFRTICEELEANPTFADRIRRELEGDDQVPARRAARRQRAALDPIAILRSQGEKTLRDRLQTLDVEKLKDIVAEYGMDTAKLVMKWKTSDRIIEHIVATAA